MLEILKQVIQQVLNTPAYVRLRYVTYQLLRFPMTVTSIQIPFFGIFIAILIAFPIDMLLFLLCLFMNFWYALVLVEIIFRTIIKNLK